jgi:hypothetical protein
MARPKSIPSDPLIAALIAKLPAPGSEFPVDRQIAWLNLMATALGVIYGGDAAAKLSASANPVAPAANATKPSPPPPPAKPKYPFIIDEMGFVRNAKGKRIKPDEVTDTIFDLRGIDGDLKSIVWADDSTGLNGRDLTISAA